MKGYSLKNTLMIVLVVSLLVVGILVMKNMGGGDEKQGVSKQEAMEKAEKVAEDSQKRLNEIQKKQMNLE